MQAENITIAVDVLNDGNTVDQSFDRNRVEGNKSTYLGSASSDLCRDTLNLFRGDPKTGGGSNGTRRSTVKFTKDQLVDNQAGDGQHYLPLVGDVVFAVPVGTTAAECKLIRQRLIAMLDDDALMDDLMLRGEI